jgi:hypothetical protein
MDLTIVSLIISVLAILLSFFAVTRSVAGKQAAPVSTNSFESAPLRLQAYERLVLLTERISLGCSTQPERTEYYGGEPGSGQSPIKCFFIRAQ